MTLAIGDGANDVPMIMAAHVGVGISGNEGMQAVRSADYAIAQFRYLKPLLLVHGRNNYIRVTRLILYVFYKNTCCVSALFLYNLYTGCSGTTLFELFLQMSFNFFFTGGPIIIYGFMEQDISPESALLYPQLYLAGQRRELFNLRVAASWALNAFVHTVLMCLIPVAVYQEDRTTDLYVAGTAVMLLMVMAINLRLLLITNYHTDFAWHSCWEHFLCLCRHLYDVKHPLVDLQCLFLLWSGLE